MVSFPTSGVKWSKALNHTSQFNRIIVDLKPYSTLMNTIIPTTLRKLWPIIQSHTAKEFI